MTSKLVFFDVGANDGRTLLERAVVDGHIVVAFEPTKTLARQIRSWAQNLPNYILVEKAVSDFDGTATFNVGDKWDGGVSSLETFSDHLETTWAGRTDLVVTDRYEVAVTRLDTWIEQNMPDLQSIQYLHVDTQGSDLKVLKGMGKYINLVQGGQVEVPNSPEVALYKNQHTKEEMVDFLTLHGFEITGRHDQMNEHNLIFTRKTV